MGFFSWLGFGKPRDAPTGVKTERPGLPEITDKDGNPVECLGKTEHEGEWAVLTR